MVTISFIIILFLSSTIEASTETVIIYNSANKKGYKALVILPDSYKRLKKSFPVIFLLHGYSGNYTLFSRIVNLEKYSSQYQVLFVCPDGNYNSWYINSPVRKDSQFESFIIKDVIPFIDRKYKTIATKEGRAIVGSSMGGHGALTLLVKNDDLFCGAGSISGILDLTDFQQNWDLKDILGEYSTNIKMWEENSFYYILDRLFRKNKYLIIDCGESDFALSVNRKTHQKLNRLGITHTYFERPGSHDIHYIKKVLPHHIDFFAEVMNPN